MEQLKSISDLLCYSDRLSAEGQTSDEQFEHLKESGVEVIIKISHVPARNSNNEEHEMVENLNMDDVNFSNNLLNSTN
jgi:hypothetical protein